jgi:hypothetical protein
LIKKEKPKAKTNTKKEENKKEVPQVERMLHKNVRLSWRVISEIIVLLFFSKKD